MRRPKPSPDQLAGLNSLIRSARVPGAKLTIGEALRQRAGDGDPESFAWLRRWQFYARVVPGLATTRIDFDKPLDRQFEPLIYTALLNFVVDIGEDEESVLQAIEHLFPR
jgi:hypothetical protein